MKEDVIEENHKQADNIDLEPVSSPSNEINSPDLAPEQANQTKVLLIIYVDQKCFAQAYSSYYETSCLFIYIQVN